MAHDLKNRTDVSPDDPNFRWNGPRTDAKNAERAVAGRKFQFATIQEFQAWRASKGFPPLSPEELEACFARFRGEPVETR